MNAFPNAFPGSSPTAPQPLATYSTTLPAAQVGFNANGNPNLTARIDLPKGTVWDVVRVWAYGINVRPNAQCNFNGGTGTGVVVGPPGSRGGWPFGGLYKSSFDPANEIQLFPYITERKQFFPLDQIIRVGIGEFVLAVLQPNYCFNAAEGVPFSPVTFGIDVIEYPVQQ